MASFFKYQNGLILIIFILVLLSACRNANAPKAVCDTSKIENLQKDFFQAYSENSHSAKRIALALVRETNCIGVNWPDQANAFLNLSTYYEYHEQNYDSAVILLQKSADLHVDHADSTPYYNQLLNIGLLNAKSENLLEGKTQILSFLRYIQTVNDPLKNGYFRGKHTLAKAYMVGELWQDAKNILQECLIDESLRSNQFTMHEMINDLISLYIETDDCSGISNLQSTLQNELNQDVFNDLAKKASLAKDMICS